MKVILFCGGLGMRMRDYAAALPKPMVPIGNRPVIWHLMKYYAHYGHKDFILCLGYRGDVIKHYFLNYEESITNDFVLSDGGRRLELLSSDIGDWRITFVDTGLHANVAQRLKAVERHVAGEEMLLANYADGLTDCPLPWQLDHFAAQNKVASFLCVRPKLSYHFVMASDGGLVTDLRDLIQSGLRVNGGFFIFRKGIFRYIDNDGDELVDGPFQRLVRDRELVGYDYDGFWQSVDTAKDVKQIEELSSNGSPPWAVWNHRLPAMAR
jgi:glucose-1-phosphate cytidylyltransferase